MYSEVEGPEWASWKTVLLGVDHPRFCASLGDAHHEQVRRLITLVDVMYERGVKLICLAEALPNELFDPGPGRREDMPDEVFAIHRTVSRLFEMQGENYLKK